MSIPVSKQSFINVFSKSVYNKIVKESAIEYNPSMSWGDFKNMLSELYDDLYKNNYSPRSPENYVYSHKTLFVARTIPILSIKDEAFYYFICKYLEDDIAENRVQNTFGGWRLGNSLKDKEKEDIDEISYVYNSYRPELWNKEWKDFVNISRSFVESEKFSYVLKLDIANFYDSINLNILRTKLNEKISHTKHWAIEYVMYFLSYWNKKIDNYLPRSTGLPQTQFGEQSRLLANFYLQDYDASVKEICDQNNAEYVRFADDQLIFLKDDNYQEVIFLVNKELNKIGLNLNAQKTKLMKVDELAEYYLYYPQLLLDEQNYNKSFEEFYNIYTKNKNVRYDTYIKRIFGNKIGLNKFNLKNQSIIKSIIFDRNFLFFVNHIHLKFIYNNLSDEEKIKFINLLCDIYILTSFNSYHYTLLKFFKNNKLNRYYEVFKDLELN